METMQTLREQLRHHTGPLHQQLDAAVGELQVFSSLSRYASYLQAMKLLYERFAGDLDRIAAIADLPCNADHVIRCLATDLAAVNAMGHYPQTTHGTTSETTGTQHPGVPRTVSVCWGTAYALEGAAMGASYMVRSAPSRLPADTRFTFLEHLAVDAKERWPLFREALEHSHCQPAEAVTGAAQVFETALDIFSAAAI